MDKILHVKNKTWLCMLNNDNQNKTCVHPNKIQNHVLEYYVES